MGILGRVERSDDQLMFTGRLAFDCRGNKLKAERLAFVDVLLFYCEEVFVLGWVP